MFCLATNTEGVPELLTGLASLPCKMGWGVRKGLVAGWEASWVWMGVGVMASNLRVTLRPTERKKKNHSLLSIYSL